MNIKTLKNKDVEAELERFRKHMRFDAGVHRKTKIKTVRKNRRQTLLDDEARISHAARLFSQFNSRWGTLTSKEANSRLRFWTVLGSVCSVDEDIIAEHITMLRQRLGYALSAVKGCEVIGVIEIEIVSWDLMKSIKLQGNLSDDAARKYTTLKKIDVKSPNNLYDEPARQEPSSALIHFHGIVDLGMNADEKEKKLRASCQHYWPVEYQIELKPLFANKRTKASFQDIAKYLVKGGNENLLYKIGYGWDSIERYEAALIKAGKKKLGADFEGYENEFSLSMHEIKVLDASIDRLMNRTERSSKPSTHRNGYLFRYGQQVKWVT